MLLPAAIILLILSNATWAWRYRSLWLDAYSLGHGRPPGHYERMRFFEGQAKFLGEEADWYRRRMWGHRKQMDAAGIDWKEIDKIPATYAANPEPAPCTSPSPCRTTTASRT